MNAIHANHSRQPSGESLADVWRDLALRANTFVQLGCGLAGAAGVAALGVVPARWLCGPLVLLLLGCFALASVLFQMELSELAPTTISKINAARVLVNAMAIVAALGAALSVLALLFGGSVGLMRG